MTRNNIPKQLCNNAHTYFVTERSIGVCNTIREDQKIHVELLSYIRNVLPLTYFQLIIITDYEYGLMNAIKTILPKSDQQEC